MVVDRVNKKRASDKSTSKWLRWQLCAVLVTGSALVPTTGCTALTGVQQAWTYNSYWNEGIMGYRHTCMASKAWHGRKHYFANQPNLKDFARGFKAGYMSVADGGDGCTPAFPPREYWGWKYQSCEGQARVSAWFSGYPHGVQAAEQEGIGGWTQIQTSKGIQNEYVQHGRMPSDYNGTYPVPPIQQGFNMQTKPEALPSAELIDSSLLEFDPSPGEDMMPPLPAGSTLIPIPDPTFQ
jgi:hypothetical protein